MRTANKKQNQQLVVNNDFVGEIHDLLLDENDLDLANAYNDAVVWIAELHIEIEKLRAASSCGYLRRKSK